jgi:hypothetical protein
VAIAIDSFEPGPCVVSAFPGIDTWVHYKESVLHHSNDDEPMMFGLPVKFVGKLKLKFLID